jgi:O-antigen/teichoic acid export membrane protein
MTGRIRWNTAANLGGRAAAALPPLLELPVYLAIWGPEPTGAIALVVTVQASLGIFESGFAAVLNYAAPNLDAQSSRFAVLARALELLCWTISAALFTAAIALALAHGGRAIAGGVLPLPPVIALIALSTVLIFVGAFYTGILRATEEQVLSNILSSSTMLCRAAVSIALVFFLHADLIVVLAVYAAFGVIYAVATRVAAYRGKGRPKADAHFAQLRETLLPQTKFLLNMLYVKSMGVLASQGDRIVATLAFDFHIFGYYAVAMTLASRLNVLAAPVNMAVWPRFARYFRDDGGDDVAKAFYHKAVQGSLLIMLPAAMIVIILPELTLYAWTGNRALATSMGMPMSLLAIGTLANGLYQIPYAAQIAKGWSSLATLLTTIFAPLAFGIMWLFAPFWGPAGLGSIVAVRDLLLLGFGVVLMHRRMLQGELGHFIGRDVAPSLLWAALPPLAVLVLVDANTPRTLSLFIIAGAGLLSTILLAASFGWVRALAGDALRRLAPR